MLLRPAIAADAATIAALHAASWQRTYAGMLAADWLAGPVLADRQALWRQRFAQPPPGLQVLVADAPDGLAGFVCLLLAAHPRWGHHVDNLHVRPGLHGQGLGRQLLAAAARLGLAAAPGLPLDLLVYAGNTPARGFYERLGGQVVERFTEAAPDGSHQAVLRFLWPDPAVLATG